MLYDEIRTVINPAWGPPAGTYEVLYKAPDNETVGMDGTVYQTEWGNSTLVEFVAEPYYEPLKVTVDGVKARNITNYRTREHPAFAQTSESTLEYRYLHVGRILYFNRPIKNVMIEVDYRYLTAYMQLQAILRSTAPGRPLVTPELYNYRMMLQTARHYSNQAASSRM